MRIAIVASLFNEMITRKMIEEALRGLIENGVQEEDIVTLYVPGAFEIPALCQKVIDLKQFDGIIALGCVIKGETDHYQYICQGVAYGLQKVSIENRFPILSGILTCATIEQAMKRVKKGYECGKNILEYIKHFQ